MFPLGHLHQRICQVRLASLLLREPDFMKALPADAPTQVSVELMEREDGPWSVIGLLSTRGIDESEPMVLLNFQSHRGFRDSENTAISPGYILLTSILGSAMKSISIMEVDSRHR